MRQSLIAALGAIVLTAGVTSANAAPSAAGLRPNAPSAEAAVPPSATPTYLYLDGVSAAVVRSYQGCTEVGVVRAESNGIYEVKAVSGYAQEPCDVTIVSPMSRSIKQWIQTQLLGENVEKQVSLVRVSSAGAPVSAITLQNANLTGFALSPVRAGASNELAFKLGLTAERSLRPAASSFAGPALPGGTYLDGNNYQVTVDETVTAVTAISPIRLERSFEERFLGPWVVADLKFTVGRPQSGYWQQWYQTVVAEQEPDERVVRLDFLKPDRAIGATFFFRGVGVFGADGDVLSSGDGREFRAYVESIEWQLP